VTPQERVRVRRERSRSLVVELECWLREQRARVSKNSDTGKAIDYSLKRWTALTRFLDDGRLCMSNNAAERELRAVATRRSLCIPSSSICKHWKRVFVSARDTGDPFGRSRFWTRVDLKSSARIWCGAPGRPARQGARRS
jgi:transposase